MSIDYLLCRTENREQVNTPLTELHLSDEMVALLKSGRINNRLLCELAAHKSDSESAPPTTIAEELKQDLEDVANFKGSPLEK